ncbi:hypothetical protein BJV74DRAFT_883994 [Russula compacta]|nr:hypothetical protein BJV74DRAFT_883994 [Russula compacta]
MACRSRQRAEAARQQLLELFEDNVAGLRGTASGAERVAAFRANLSTLAFADEVARTYPYVSHIVCNAGVAPFLNISWRLLFRQVWKNALELNLFELVTNPSFHIQRTGTTDSGGPGSAIVFGHYILCRASEAKPVASETGSGRVLWMSSHAAHTGAYDPDEWQLVDSSASYEGTKFQMDSISTELSRRAGLSAPIQHFTVHPGVVNSSIDAALVGGFPVQNQGYRVLSYCDVDVYVQGDRALITSMN